MHHVLTCGKMYMYSYMATSSASIQLWKRLQHRKNTDSGAISQSAISMVAAWVYTRRFLIC